MQLAGAASSANNMQGKEEHHKARESQEPREARLLLEDALASCAGAGPPPRIWVQGSTEVVLYCAQVGIFGFWIIRWVSGIRGF